MRGIVLRRQVWLAVVAAFLAAVIDWSYLTFIRAQDVSPPPPHPGVVPFVSGYIAGVAAVALLGAALILWGKRPAATVVLVAAMTGSAALGFLAIFSIGLALLITATLLAVAAFGVAPEHRQRVPWPGALLGASVALAVLISGFAATGVFWGT